MYTMVKKVSFLHGQHRMACSVLISFSEYTTCQNFKPQEKESLVFSTDVKKHKS